MSQNLQQANSINLSAIFREVAHPLKASSLISDPEIFFNNAAYGDCLVKLGKFLSLVESSIAINVDSLIKQSPVLVSYANSFYKSIKILKHSLWFLQSVPTVENKKKFSVFQNGIDIFDNAVSVIDETIKIFFSDEVISSLQKELRSNLLCLYDCCLKNSPFLKTATTEVNSINASISKPLLTKKDSGNNPKSFEPLNVSQEIDSKLTLPTNILYNKFSSSRENSSFNTNSTLIPISCQENITFSDLGHKKRFDQICKHIKDDLNYFAIVKSRKLKLKCLLCDLIMFASKVESHIIQIDHLREKSKAPCFGTISNSAMRRTWDLTENSEVIPVSQANVLKSNSLPSFEYPFQIIEKAPDTLRNVPKSYKPFSQTANFKNITFSDPSHKKRFDEICSSIKDEVYHFNIIKSKKLKLRCLLCNQTVHASKVEDHIIEASHLHQRSKALCLSTEPDSALSTNLELAQNNLVTPVPCSNDLQPNLSSQFLGDPSQGIYKVLAASENIRKSCNPLNSSQKTIFNVVDCATPPNTIQSFFEKNLNTSTSSALISIPLEKDFIFSDCAHKKRFKEICQNIKDEVNYFKIIKSKQLKLLCLFCDQTIPASKVEHHVIEMSHLHNKSKTLGINVSSHSASSPNFDTTQTTSVSFDSNTRAPDPDALPSSENRQFTKNASDVEKTAEHIPRSNEILNSSSKTDSNTSDNANALNTNRLSSRNDLYSLNCNTTSHNSVTSESVASIPVSNLWSDISEKSLLSMAPSATVSKNSASSEISLDSSFNRNYKPISYVENFTLSKQGQKEFDSVCRMIGCQINYFLVRQSKGLKLTCLLCNEGMKASKAVGHVSQQGHLRNASLHKTGPSSVPDRFSEKAAELSEENKQFLVYFPHSRDLFCALCNLVLMPMRDAWFEHFQSEYHNVRLPLIDTSDAKNVSVADFKCNADREMANNSGIKLCPPSYSEMMDQATSKNLNDILTTQKQESVKSSGDMCEDISESKLPKFARSSHEKEFLRLKEKINDQMKKFSVHSEPNQRKLKMTCNLCKKSMEALNVETHVKEREHSQHLIASQVKEEHKKYLEFCPNDRGYRCIVCKETLSWNNSFFKVLWHGHFESETHRKNEKKLSCSVSSFLNAQTNSCADLPAKSEVMPVKEETITDLNSEQQSPHNEGKENVASPPKYVSNAGISLNSKRSCSTELPSVFENSAANDKKFKNSELKLSLFKQSTAVDLNFAHNCGNVPAKVKNSTKSAPRVIFALSSSTPTFPKFKESSYTPDYCKHQDKVSHHKKLFSIEDEEGKKKHIMVCCNLCDKGMSVNNIVAHMDSKTHLHNCNAKEILISEENRMFLDHRSGRCTLCNVPLHQNQHLWLEHFRSKFHNNLKSQMLHAKKKGTVSEAIKRAGPVMFVSNLSKTNINSSLQSHASKHRSCDLKQSAAINCDFAQNFIDIFTEIDSLESTPLKASLQSTFKPDKQEFKHTSHAQQYVKFCNQIKGQIKHFSIVSDQKKKGLEMMCKLCNQLIAAKNIKCHVTSVAHLRRLIVPFVSKDNMKFLHDVVSLRCLLCNVRLFRNQCLWVKHFQSKSHILKLKKYNDDHWSLRVDSGLKTLLLSNIQNDENLSESVHVKAYKNVVAESEIFKTPDNLVENQNRKDLVSETLQSGGVITYQSNLVKTSLLPSLQSSLECKQEFSHPKHSTAIDIYFARNYVNIFAKDKNSLDLTSPYASESQFKLSSSEFKEDSHKKEYDALCGQIGGQIWLFVINSAPQRKLTLMCKICNKLMSVKRAVSHVTCIEHLANLMAPFMNEESKMHLGRSKTVCCTLCDIPLYKNQCLWFKHFQSELHNLKLQELHDDFWSLKVDSYPKMPEECEKINADCEISTKCGQIQSNLLGKLGVSRVVNFEDSAGVNSNVKLPAGPGSATKNDEKENISGIQNHANILESVIKSARENISSNTKMFKTSKNVIVNRGNIEDCSTKTTMRADSIAYPSNGSNNSVGSSFEPFTNKPLTYFKKSTVTDIDFTQNYVNIFAKAKGPSDSTLLEALKLSLPEFKQDAHKRQYDALHGQIGDQIQHFSFKSAPQKKLRMTCMLCIRSMSVKKASSHITCNDHLSNLMAPFMSKESKMYLENHSKTIHCTLCDVPLYINRCLWFEHFQSEFHFSKLQEYHNDYWSLQVDSSSKKSAKSDNFDRNCLKHSNYGLQFYLKTENNVTYKNSANGSNVNFEPVIKLGTSAKSEKNYSLSGAENYTNLPEAGSEDASNLSARESSSKYVYDLTTLQFAQYLHSIQFMRLIQKVNDQVNHFSFESHPESRDLKFICKVCNESFTNADMVASHVKMQEHKLNLGLYNSNTLSVPAIRECSWMFLKPCLSSKGFRCTWCNVKLSSEFNEWMDHFQSEAHILKLERPPTSSNLNASVNSKSDATNSETAYHEQGNSLAYSNPFMISEVVPAAASAKKNTNNTIGKRNDITPELCIPPPIPLEGALNADFILATEKFDKEKLETLMAELDFQVNFFLIHSTKFEGGRIKVICKLCARSLAVSKVVDHIESRSHFQNMIIPLISKESRIYLDWCSVTRNYSCSLCKITLSRGMCLLEHFQSNAHLLKLQELNVSGRSPKNDQGVKCSTGSEDFKFNEELTTDCLPAPARSSVSIVTSVKHSDLSAEINALSRIKKTLKLYRNKQIFNFLNLACSVEDQVNFFSFEAGPEDLNMICQLCKVSFTEVEFAIDHVHEKKHVINCEKNKNEVIVVPWIPRVCDDNWKFLWPFPDLRNYFCTVCNRVLHKPILSWVHHFRSKSHIQKLRELHQDLLTVETCFLSNGNRDKDWALGTLAPENLFQDSFNLEALQFLSVAHQIQFENLAKKINYQINYFSISVQKQSKELILTCKVCNETVFVSEAEEHVNEQEHLLNLAVKCESKPDTCGSEISQDDWQYLDFNTSSQEYVCTLCDVQLSSSKESWAEHFQSKVHRLLVEEPQTIGTIPAKEKFASESINCSDDETIKDCLEKTEECKSITNELCLTDGSPFKSTNHFEKFINKCEEIVLKLSSPEFKKQEKSKFIFSLNSPEIKKPEKPKEFFDLHSVFRFFKVEDYFTSFFDLTGTDKRVLKKNCRFILIDEESQEVFCTACHCFNSVRNDTRSLKNLIGHFLGAQHQANSHSYGPAAFFQFNISLIKFFDSKSGFCPLCSVTISCYLPADVDLLLDHFESQKHADLVRKVYERESAYAEDKCVTLVLSQQKN